MTKKRKQQSLAWCWYCDREFDDEKVLINHQKAKHFKCLYCYKKLNSGSGLVIHIAQLHKESVVKIPNSIEGHDTPELEIYGMDGVPEEDLKRHRQKLPPIPYRRSRLMEPGAGIIPLLAAQKAAVPDEPSPMVPVQPLPPFPRPAPGTSKPVSPTTSSDNAQKAEASGVVSGAPVSYASPPMPMAGQMYHPGYPPPSGYYPAYYPGYGVPPYYPPPGSTGMAPPAPYGYPMYPSQYYHPQYPGSGLTTPYPTPTPPSGPYASPPSNSLPEATDWGTADAGDKRSDLVAAANGDHSYIAVHAAH